MNGMWRAYPDGLSSPAPRLCVSEEGRATPVFPDSIEYSVPGARPPRRYEYVLDGDDPGWLYRYAGEWQRVADRPDETV